MSFLTKNHFFGILDFVCHKTERRPPLASHVLVLIATHKIVWLRITRKIIFLNKWAPYARWGGDRTIKAHIVAMRAFVLLLWFSTTNIVFRHLDISWLVVVVLTFCEKNKPKISQKCLGVVGEHPRPVLDNFWHMLDQNRLRNYIRWNPCKNQYINPSPLSSYGSCYVLSLTSLGSHSKLNRMWSESGATL